MQMRQVPAAAWLLPLALVLLLATAPPPASASASARRALRQTVSGCDSAGPAGSLIAANANATDGLIAGALVSSWPAFSEELTAGLAAANVTKSLAAQTISIKQCLYGDKLCFNLTLKLSGGLHARNITLEGMQTPMVYVDNITCLPLNPTAPLAVALNVEASLAFTADVLTVEVSGELVGTLKSIFGLSGSYPLTFNGLVTVLGVQVYAKAQVHVNGTYVPADSKVDYLLAVKDIRGVQTSFAEVLYIDSRVPADGSASLLLQQVEALVSSLAVPLITPYIDEQIVAALDANLGKLTLKGSLAM